MSNQLRLSHERSADTKACFGVAALVASAMSAIRWLAPVIHEIVLALGWSLALYFWLRLRDETAGIKRLIENEERMIRELVDRKKW
jgi:uncharacterized membrane protein YciS (DUF1049 family)